MCEKWRKRHGERETERDRDREGERDRDKKSHRHKRKEKTLCVKVRKRNKRKVTKNFVWKEGENCDPIKKDIRTMANSTPIIR